MSAPNPAAAPTLGELRTLVATMLAGVTEGPEDIWWQLIGPLERLPRTSMARFNWRVRPAGTPQEIATIEHVGALVQAEHPYASE